MHIITLANLKGGCGKSTIAGSVAGCLQSQGHSVVAIDADDQRTLSLWVSLGDWDLECHTLPLSSGSDVKAWVNKVKSFKADYLIIDAPPHLQEASQAAITIADLVCVPVKPSASDLMATGRAIEVLKNARKARGDKRPKCLLVPSMVDIRTLAGREIASALSEVGEGVGPPIRQLSHFVDCITGGQWVGDFAPDSPAHKDIKALTNTIKGIL